nr:non-ribosomal peptide synthetase [Isoptericola halotolerans]
MAQDGVGLWADGEQLRFRAPAGSLDAGRKAWLTENKAEVLAHLRHVGATRETPTTALASADRPGPALVPAPEDRHRPFPLTELQAAYLLGRGSAFEYGGVACHAYLELRYDRPEQRARLTDGRLDVAWRAVVSAHDMLRAVIHTDGFQSVLPEVTAPAVPVHRGELADEVRERLEQRVPQPDRWPLIAVEVTDHDDHTLLHLSVDLVVLDHASLHLLVTELEARLFDDAAPEPPGCTFRDYVVARRGELDGPQHERDRAYWQERLATLPPAPELPRAEWATTPPPAGRPFRRHATLLDPVRTATLTERAREAGLSLSTVLLTCYAEVVGRWSRRPGFTVVIPTFTREIAGDTRPHPDIDRVLGDFTATELLAVDTAGPATPVERGRRLQAQLLEDLAHRSFSGSQVQTERSRDDGNPELFPVVFTSTVDQDLPPTAGRVAHARTQSPQVWLDCQVMRDGDGLVLSWDVRDGVLPDGVTDDMFSAWVDLVDRLVDDPSTWSDPDPVRLPAADRARREAANATDAPLPDGLLHDDVLTVARTAPDRTAVVGADGSLTFGELVGRARGVAHALTAEGVAPQDRVAIVMDKCPEQVVAALGVLLAGAVYVPVETTSPASRRAAIVADAGATAVLTVAALRTAASQGVDVPVVAVDEVPPRDDAPSTSTTPDDLAYVIYTSGSTGTPKGVMIAHRAARNTCVDVDERFAVGPQDAVLGLAGLGFDLSVWDVFGVLGAGGRLVLPAADRRGDAAHWAELVEQHGVTLWNTVPGQLQMLSDYARSSGAAQLRTLRLALLSGDWIPVTLPDQVREQLPGLEVVSLGGATEGAIWSIWHPVGAVDRERPSIPYGTPLRNQRFAVRDHRGRDAPAWVPGELEIIGAGVADGYLGDPERTGERFGVGTDGLRTYRTGDVGRWVGDGTLEFLGREDSQVKIRGYRIELAEVEAAVLDHPGVGQAAVVVDDERRHLVAAVEPAARPVPDPSAEPAVASLRTRLVTPRVDSAAVAASVEAADQVGLDVIVTTLAPALGDGAALTAEEISDRLDVAPEMRSVVRRWLRVLTRHDLAFADGPRHRLAPEASDRPVDRHADELAARAGAAGWSTALPELLARCGKEMPALLRGERDIRSLLVDAPGTGEQAGTAVMAAAYRHNLAVAELTDALAVAIGEQCALVDGATVLEVGAGAGDTTEAVVAATASLDVTVVATDASPLAAARLAERFDGVEQVRCERFDPDVDLSAQGREPCSVDVVIAAHSLHTCRDVPAALARLVELLRPGGWLVVVDNVRDDDPALAVSMELLEMTHGPFDDRRASSDRLFLDTAELHDALEAAGAVPVVSGPAPEDGLATAGQHLVLARAKPDRTPVRAEDVERSVRRRLPEYMVPSRWRVLDRLPTTANRKVDRAALLALAGPRATEAAAGADEPMSVMERQIAGLWAELLGLDHVGRDDDFFALGGDSLLVARFVGLLRERVPDVIAVQWEVVLRHMLRQPTVAHLARYLTEVSRAQDPAAAAPTAVRTSPLVPLHGSGDGPTTVLVHAGTGTAMPYRALVTDIRRRSAGTSSIAALEICDLAAFQDDDPDGLIERIAADYAEALVSSDPGEIHLVGYCLGGLIATEVARHLADRGHDVRSLTVVSSHSPAFRLDDEVLAEYSFSVMMGIDPADLGYPGDELRVAQATDEVLRRSPGVIPDGGLAALDGDFADVGAAFGALAELTVEQRVERMCEAVPADAGMYSPEHMMRLLRTFRQSVFAISRYRPDPYLGDVTFCRHSGTYPFPGSKEAVTAQWEQVVLGDLDILDVAGDHFTCLTSENSAGIVEILQRTTDGAVLR